MADRVAQLRAEREASDSDWDREKLAERIAKLGENIQVRRFARFKVGEGVEKPAVDFSEEVKAQVAG